MLPWTCPPQWLNAEREAHDLSLRLLDSIVEPNAGMELELNPEGLPRVFIHSASSGRWYKLDTFAVMEDHHGEACGFYDEPRFEFSIMGGFDRRSVHHETDAAAMLCLHPGLEHQHLPVGDQVAALALALYNDRATALRIPLMAQFIACNDVMLRDIFQFSVEGILHYDGIYDLLTDHEAVPNDAGPHGFFTLDPRQLTSMNVWGCAGEDREGTIIDDWFDRIDRTISSRRHCTWHHDPENVWLLEERLMDGSSQIFGDFTTDDHALHLR